ncbi:MAG: DUF2849 domain-containing protein [Methylobacterium mesophilicum]|nr:DUF2849 domain-containing protein [Methylobacterium mesophilicum]
MKVLTANRLSDGIAVWWSETDGWIKTILGAKLAATKDDEAALDAVGAEAGRANLAVDINLIDVTVVEGVPVPVRIRERIRAAGPTNRTDLGKQAEGKLPPQAAPMPFVPIVSA